MSPVPPIPRRQRRSLPATLAVGGLAVVAAAVLVACQPAVPDARAAAPAAAPAPTVPVATVRSVARSHGTAQVARVEAAERVELRARVAGPVTAVLFRDGELVRAGQPLFQIDPRPHEAAVARARAELLLASTRETHAAAEAERARTLHAERAIATEELERRTAAHGEARARRAVAEAALQAAQLELEFTVVRAPIAGRAGRALVTPGNVVSTGASATPLTSIVAVAPLHVHFDVAERGVVGRLGRGAAPRGWKARILDAEGREVLAEAPVDFAYHSIDPATGTLRLRARVDPPGAALMPGQYVRVQLATGDQDAVLTVPDPALGTDQGRRFVLVVDADGTVAYRAVVAGALHEGQRIVTQGLRAGERVIVSGLMRVRPGMRVTPQPAGEVAARVDARGLDPEPPRPLDPADPPDQPRRS